MFRKTVFIFVSLLIVTEKTNAQAVNIDFESSSPGTYTAGNSVTGWSLTSQTATSCGSGAWISGSSEFSLVNTPILNFPQLGAVGNSPLGGNIVAMLNNQTANSSVTKLSQVISVTNNNYSMQFAFAGVWQYHTNGLCCETAGFQVVLKDQNGILLNCHSFTVNGQPFCGASIVTTVTTNGSGPVAWTNWQSKAIDLSPYINSNITIEIISNDCIYGDHYGTLLCDLKFGLPFSCFCGVGIVSNDPYYGSKFCSGSSVAQISAPLGYATYSWTGPVPILPSQSTLATITVSNQPLGSIFTVSMITVNGCVFTTTYAINTTTVSIAGIISNSTCIMGSSGSATVVGTGSGTGYNYAWYDSNNSVISTNSSANNLSAGVYTVSITSAGSTSSTCGTAVSTVTIGTKTSVPIVTVKPFCGSSAYFSAPSTGTNYQWYYNQAAISSPLGGTNSTYTLTSPASGSVMTLGMTSQGCRDSIQYYLFATQSGSLSSIGNPIACPNSTNGVAILSMNVGGAAQFGTYSFSIVNSNSSTPSYSVISNNGNSYIFTASGLASGGNYLATSFDGACYYNLNFSVTPYVLNYNISSPGSYTLCPTNTITSNVIFQSGTNPNEYAITRIPSTYFFAGITTFTSSWIACPSSLSIGTQTTITYSVIVTPTFINCPETKTFNVTFANPIAPGISNIPDLCNNDPAYAITTIPQGGVFSNNIAVSANGVITPSLAFPGVNIFTCTNSSGTCAAQSSGTFMILNSPTLQISGNTTLCKGQSTTLLAQGADTYSWNGMTTGPVYSSSPTIDTTYYITGGNSFGCYTTSLVPIHVIPLPVLSLLGDTSICKGESTILYASGADAYNWNGSISSSTINVSPLVNTSYTVTGINNPGACTSTAVIAVNVSDCVDTGIADLSSQSGIRVFPNPSSGILFIETNEEKDIILSDLSGKIIYSHKLEAGAHSLDLGPLADGYYLLKVRNNNAGNTYKILKGN